MSSSDSDHIDTTARFLEAAPKIIDKTTVLDAQTLPRVEMPNRDGFISDPRPEIFK
jgi:cytochrome c